MPPEFEEERPLDLLLRRAEEEMAAREALVRARVDQLAFQPGEIRAEGERFNQRREALQDRDWWAFKPLYDEFLKPVKKEESEVPVSKMSAEELSAQVEKLRRTNKELKASRDLWAQRYDRQCQQVTKLEQDLNVVRKSVTQTEVRTVLNRALKIHKLPPLDVGREASKADFLCSLSNHLNQVLSKDVPNDELPT